MAQTRVAAPTQTPLPTPTLIPLSKISLEAIILQPGDLPTEFVGGQVKSKPLVRFEEVPVAEQAIQQSFRAGAYASDGVMILLYKSSQDIETGYNTLTSILGKDKDKTSKPLSVVGEKATIAQSSVAGVKSVQVVFVRCHALTYVDLFSTSANADVATTYAQRLDKRLSSLVCP